MTAKTTYIPTQEYAVIPHVGLINYDVAASTLIPGGVMVGIDSSGNAVNATATGCKFIAGRADKTVDNSTGSAGDLTIDVQPGVFWWKNGDSITKSSIGDRAYVSDNWTVTKAATEQGVAGIIVAVDSSLGVAVASFGAIANSNVNPVIQSGTSTLVAGTKAVTTTSGLTSSSVILLTMRDPGAGAITGMAGLDAPVASRNTTTGVFTVNAIDDAKATIATAVCTFDWVVIG